jgi:hypothetical protein
VRLEGLGKLKKKKSSIVVESLNRELPACNTVPQPTMLHRASVYIVYETENVKKYCNRSKRFGPIKIYEECEEIDEVCVVTYLIA